MTSFETIDFAFVTNTSGSFDALLKRLNKPKEEATPMALTYYILYLNGLEKKGSPLVMVSPDGKTAWELDDDRIDDHVETDTISVSIDEQNLHDLTRISGKDDPADMLTSAFILLEKICDALDKKWSIGLYSRSSKEIKIIKLKMTPLSPGEIGMDLSSPASTPAPPRYN